MRREVSAAGEGTHPRRPSMAARTVAVVFGCVLLAGAAQAARARHEAPAARRYRNVDYEYVVRLPRGLRIETNQAPAPNHGFGVTIAPAASAWVDATYATTDAATYAAEVEQVRQYGRDDGCRETEHTAASLGGVPATELAFQCPAGGRRPRPTVERVRLTVRQPPEHGPIVYQVGIEYPQGSEKAADAERVYRALVGGFAFTGPR